MSHGYLIVEGHGELKAALNLVTRLWTDLDLAHVSWREPMRGTSLLSERGVALAAERVRRSPEAGMLLLLRDNEDTCPRASGPQGAKWLQGLALPFPAAVALFYREYETIFLASLPSLVGRPYVVEGSTRSKALSASAAYTGDLEAKRGVKEWLSRRMDERASYKPTVDQLPLTRFVDFELVRSSGLACFGTLERALRFLDANRGRPGAVYPPVP